MILKIKGNKIWFSSIAILLVVMMVTTIVQLSNVETSQSSISTSITSDKTENAVVVMQKKSTQPTIVKDMRGVWVPYMSLETQEHNEQSFKSNFDSIIKTAVENNLNTLIVHIRPFSDALYKSDIFPYSHILTGSQGESVDYDPLEYMIKKCHENKLKFHAWVNPYRIATSDTPREFSENNIINTLSNDDIIEYDGGKYINPSSTKGRQIIVDGVKEIVKNYDVDGVQFDDYFYPSADLEYDKAIYESYLSMLDEECTALSHKEWRQSNVNILISSVYSSIKQIKSSVIFGISPQGNISNCYDIGADVKTWCNTSGYADYICPQMYVNFDHSILPFDKMVSDWKEINPTNNVPLCVGLALYKAGTDSDNGTWQNKTDILKSEVEYCKENGIDNFIIYDIDYFKDENAREEVKNVISVL